MRFMVIVKANSDTEAGKMPSTEELAEMGNYNDELIKAGIMLAGEGLLSSAKGSRVRFDKSGTSSVVDGPFAETKELVAGFWLWQCKNRDEAIAWLKRAPFKDAELEIRQIAEADDFGAEYTDELRAQEDRQRRELEAQN